MRAVARCLCVAAAVVCCSLSMFTGVAADASDDWDYTLEHSLNGVDFQPRNKFRIRTPDIDSGKRKVEFSPYAVSTDEVAKIQALSRDGKSYILRANIRAPEAKPAYVAAHVPACALVASGFVESIIFHLDSADRVIAFEYANEIPAASDPRCTDSSGAYTKIKSRGVVSSLTSSKLPVAIEGNLFYNAPPGSAQAAASGAAGGSGGNAAPAEEPSFFQKYKWYLIIGAGVYVVMNVLNNPQLQQAAQAAQAK